MGRDMEAIETWTPLEEEEAAEMLYLELDTANRDKWSYTLNMMGSQP